MTKDDIIRMAREAGLADANGVVHAAYQLEAFAKLVAEHEREACAKVCDEINNDYDGEEVSASWIATAIRARETT